MHELYDTAANEGLGVRVAHGDQHVPADGDASAPFREYGRVVLKAADPNKQRRRGGNICSEIETGGGEIFGQHAVVFRKECELMGGKFLSEDRGRSKTKSNVAENAEQQRWPRKVCIPGVLRNYGAQVPSHLHEHVIAAVDIGEQALPVAEDGADLHLLCELGQRESEPRTHRAHLHDKRAPESHQATTHQLAASSC